MSESKVTLDEWKQRIIASQGGLPGTVGGTAHEPGVSTTGGTPVAAMGGTTGKSAIQDQERLLRILKDEVTQLNKLYYGQPELGIPGWANRVREIEDRLRSLEDGLTRINTWMETAANSLVALCALLDVTIDGVEKLAEEFDNAEVQGELEGKTSTPS